MVAYRTKCPLHRGSRDSFCVKENGSWFCYACEKEGSSLPILLIYLYGLEGEYAIEEAQILLEAWNQEDGVLDIEDLLTSLCEGNPYALKKRESLDDLYQRNILSAQKYAQGNFEDDPLAFTDWTHPSTNGMISMLSRGFLSETMIHFHVTDWERFPDHPIFMPLFLNETLYGYVRHGLSDRSTPRHLTMRGMRKSDHVYGYAPRGAKYGLVVEGKTDQYAAWQYGCREEDGFANFALLGSSVSSAQAKEIAENCDIVLSAVDMDAAGDAAHASLVQQLRPYDKEIHRLLLPAKDVELCTLKEFRTALSKFVR